MTIKELANHLTEYAKSFPDEEILHFSNHKMIVITADEETAEIDFNFYSNTMKKKEW